MNNTSKTFAFFLSFLLAHLIIVTCGENKGGSKSLAIGPSATFVKAFLRTSSTGHYLTAEDAGGSILNADRTVPLEWETFNIVDNNGGLLESGDQVFIRTYGWQFVQVTDGEDIAVNAKTGNTESWETFEIIKKEGDGEIKNGELVGFKSISSGRFLSALNGGGGGVDVHGESLRTWEEFVIVKQGETLPTPETPIVKVPTPVKSESFSSILSEGDFQKIFPNRNSFYTYKGLVEAADSVNGFAKTGDLNQRKFEVSAFLANVSHETGLLRYVEQIEKGDYCANSSQAPCASGKRYYGRGPIQLSWNFNYKAAGDFFNLPLLTDPDLVARSPKVAWQTSLWFWMTQTGAGNDTPHNHSLKGNFGETIRSINGVQECSGGPNTTGVKMRGEYLKGISKILGISTGSKLGC